MIKTKIRQGEDVVAMINSPTVEDAKAWVVDQTPFLMNQYGRSITYEIDDGERFYIGDQHGVTFTRIEEGTVFCIMPKHGGQRTFARIVADIDGHWRVQS